MNGLPELPVASFLNYVRHFAIGRQGSFEVGRRYGYRIGRNRSRISGGVRDRRRRKLGEHRDSANGNGRDKERKTDWVLHRSLEFKWTEEIAVEGGA